MRSLLRRRLRLSPATAASRTKNGRPRNIAGRGAIVGILPWSLWLPLARANRPQGIGRAAADAVGSARPKHADYGVVAAAEAGSTTTTAYSTGVVPANIETWPTEAEQCQPRPAPPTTPSAALSRATPGAALSPAQLSEAQPSTAQPSPAQRGSASTAQHSSAQPSEARPAQLSPARRSEAQLSPARLPTRWCRR